MGIRQTIGRWLGYERPQGQSVEVAAAMMAELRRLRAGYDAARNGNEYVNLWSNADRFDADSAHSKAIRHSLISRSREEINNNGFSDGIAQTYATDLIGLGPSLRMLTSSQGLNQLIEFTWFNWAKAIDLRSKLWTMAHAKHSDGEGFGIIRRNPRVNHPIKLDLQLVEAEQCQTPWLPFGEKGYIDGIKFDEFGNPIWYEFLKEHPGSTNRADHTDSTERIAAELVLHWFKRRRPGQHRGVPECSSTLNVGAAARRWREATLAAAETAADFSLLMKTQQTPDEADAVAPFSTMDITKRMMAFLPAGWDPTQLKAEFPTATHESFSKSLINEQARPKSMPYNKAACDSSDYNYASGRLDHQTYYAASDVERADCDSQVMDKLFRVWLIEAIPTFGWFGGNATAINPMGLSHLWDWPKHQAVDIKAEADANKTKLGTGQVGLHRIYSDAGLDLEDEIPAMARTFGIEPDELRKRMLDTIFPPVQQGGAPGQQPEEPSEEEAVQAALSLLRARGITKVNGVHHG